MGATSLKDLLAGRKNLGLVAGMLAAVSMVSFAACAPYPSYQVSPDQVAAQPPSPPRQVYFYPNRGQSEEQQERDRYECYLWATRQTGFDPSAPQLAPHQRLEVIPEPPPGANTLAGAATGAVLGAIVAPHHRAGEGAAIGAVAGAIIGAASDAARQEQAARIQQYYDRRAAQSAAGIEEQAQDYQRAMAACLEGRGYTVSR